MRYKYFVVIPNPVGLHSNMIQINESVPTGQLVSRLLSYNTNCRLNNSCYIIDFICLIPDLVV